MNIRRYVCLLTALLLTVVLCACSGGKPTDSSSTASVSERKDGNTMKTLEEMQENIIPAENQNKQDLFLYDGTGVRILFVGNSITLHGLKPEVGWNQECGMAASDIDHDYVHVLMSKVKKLDPNAAFSICQVAGLERNYDDPTYLEKYRSAADFHPDIVIMFFGANVPQEKCDDDPAQVELFAQMVKSLRDMVKGDHATVYHSQGFYIRPKLDEAKKKVALACGDGWISIDDINKREDTHGMFNHPNDQGMAEIAERFYEAIEPTLKKLIENKN